MNIINQVVQQAPRLANCASDEWQVYLHQAKNPSPKPLELIGLAEDQTGPNRLLYVLTDQEIQDAIDEYYPTSTYLTNYDCIRICVEWLSAQDRLEHPVRSTTPYTHLIQSWGGLMVGESDVEVAAYLLGLKGKYPYYNISEDLIFPNTDRLAGIADANMDYSCNPKFFANDLSDYTNTESGEDVVTAINAAEVDREL